MIFFSIPLDATIFLQSENEILTDFLDEWKEKICIFFAYIREQKIEHKY